MSIATLAELQLISSATGDAESTALHLNVVPIEHHPRLRPVTLIEASEEAARVGVAQQEEIEIIGLVNGLLRRALTLFRKQRELGTLKQCLDLFQSLRHCDKIEAHDFFFNYITEYLLDERCQTPLIGYDSDIDLVLCLSENFYTLIDAMATTAQLDSCPYFPFNPVTMNFPSNLKLLNREARHCDAVTIALQCLKFEKILRPYHTEEEPFEETTCSDFIALYDGRGNLRKRRISEGPTVAIPDTNTAIAIDKKTGYTGSTINADGHGSQIVGKGKRTFDPLLTRGKQSLEDILADKNLKAKLFKSIFGKKVITKQDFDISFVKHNELPQEKDAEWSETTLDVPTALLKKDFVSNPTPPRKEKRKRDDADESPQDVALKEQSKIIKEQATKIELLEKFIRKENKLKLGNAATSLRLALSGAMAAYAEVVGSEFSDLETTIDGAVQDAKFSIGLGKPAVRVLSSSESSEDDNEGEE